MNFPMQASARVEPGSLTPALSRGRGSRVLPSATCLYPVLPSRRDSLSPTPGLANDLVGSHAKTQRRKEGPAEKEAHAQKDLRFANHKVWVDGVLPT